MSWSVNEATQTLQIHLSKKVFVKLESQDLRNILGFTDVHHALAGPTKQQPVN